MRPWRVICCHNWALDLEKRASFSRMARQLMHHTSIEKRPCSRMGDEMALYIHICEKALSVRELEVPGRVFSFRAECKFINSALISY
jgi:hypothetical protein